MMASAEAASCIQNPKIDIKIHPPFAPPATSGHEKPPMNEYQRALILLATGCAFAASLAVDALNTTRGGSIDLRNRITGWRLLAAGTDPYHHKWTPDQPDRLLDLYNNPAVAISKTTVTPTFLLLHAPVATLNYRDGQFVWLLAQWGCLIGTLLLWQRCLPTQNSGFAWLVVATLAFTCTAAWRLHAERGQSYVVMLAVMAVWITISLKPWRARLGDWLAGAAAGLLVALRPPLLAVVAPVLGLRLRGQWPGFALGLLIAAGLPMLWSTTCWADYARGMEEWSRLYRENINPRPGPQPFPEFIEGMPVDLMAAFLRIPFADSSVFYLLRKAGVSSPIPALPVLALFLTGAVAWFWLTRHSPLTQLLAGAAALAFAIDFFLPALRNNYNDVLILNAAALGGLALSPRLRQWPARMTLAGAAAGILALAFTWRSPLAINLSTLFHAAAALLILVPPLFHLIKTSTAPARAGKRAHSST